MGMRIIHAHVHFALLRTADLGAASNNTAAVKCFNNTGHMMKENGTFIKPKSFNFQVTKPILGLEHSWALQGDGKYKNRWNSSDPVVTFYPEAAFSLWQSESNGGGRRKWRFSKWFAQCFSWPAAVAAAGVIIAKRGKGQAVRHGIVEEQPHALRHVSAVDDGVLQLAVANLLLWKVTQLTHTRNKYTKLFFIFFHLYLLPEDPVQVKPFY